MFVTKSYAAATDAFVIFGPFELGDWVELFLVNHVSGSSADVIAASWHAAKPSADVTAFGLGRQLFEGNVGGGNQATVPLNGSGTGRESTFFVNEKVDAERRFLAIWIQAATALDGYVTLKYSRGPGVEKIVKPPRSSRQRQQRASGGGVVLPGFSSPPPKLAGEGGDVLMC